MSENLLTRREIKALRAHPGRYQAHVNLCAAGLKPCEVYALRTVDLDFAAGLIHVVQRRHGQPGQFTYQFAPTYAQRDVRMSARLAKVLGQHLDIPRRDALRPFAAATAPNINNWLDEWTPKVIGRAVNLEDLRFTRANRRFPKLGYSAEQVVAELGYLRRDPPTGADRTPVRETARPAPSRSRPCGYGWSLQEPALQLPLG